MKPGNKTSEFWLTVAVSVASLFASVAGALPAKYAAVLSTVSTALYALARGWAKSSGLPPAPPAPPAK